MRIKYPHIGQRIIKSSVSVLICFLIYYARGEKGIPFYSAIAALQCIQPFIENSYKVAANRAFGTFNGAFWGSIVVMATLFLGLENTIYSAVINSVFIIAVILTATKLKQKAAGYFSCVVFLCITSVHMADDAPLIFVLTRVTDTLIGIGVALIVNIFHLPHKKRDNILFVSELDYALVKDESFLPYSKIELNRMIAQGAKFTISTVRTPASSLAPLKDINLNLPIVTMNGAALYDIHMNKFLKIYTIPPDITLKINLILNKMDIFPFVTIIIQDVLLIYFEKFTNMTMQDIFRRLRPSPYRNYIMEKPPENRECVYLYAVDTEERIINAKKAVEESEFAKDIKIYINPTANHQGYYDMKIYSVQADKEKLINYIASHKNLDRIITFGNESGEYDYTVDGSDYNSVVRKMKKLYMVSPFYKE